MTKLHSIARRFFSTILEIIRFVIKSFFYLKGRLCLSPSNVLFVPHPSMCLNDRYSIINYKSDNSLSLLNYILTNGFLPDKTFYVAVSENESIERNTEYVKKKFPHAEVKFLRIFFSQKKLGRMEYLHNFTEFCSIVSSSSHIFTSSTFISFDYSLRHLISKQVVVDLNYFSAPFKNDILSDSNHVRRTLLKQESIYSFVICPSELSARLFVPSSTLSYSKYVNLGMCRNDYLLSDEYPEQLRRRIVSDVTYQVRYILLYTPTHRDYECSDNSDNFRPLLGFEADLQELDNVLKSFGVIILAKLHPAQNKKVIKCTLPESVKIFSGDEYFGLNELMKVSDVLMTDYSSGYFDYLLLDKPVIFNFYDFDKYLRYRGLSYSPIDSVIAGDVVRDMESLRNALSRIEINRESNRMKRHFVRDLFFADTNSCSCERVYKYFFN